MLALVASLRAAVAVGSRPSAACGNEERHQCAVDAPVPNTRYGVALHADSWSRCTLTRDRKLQKRRRARRRQRLRLGRTSACPASRYRQLLRTREPSSTVPRLAFHDRRVITGSQHAFSLLND
ncbi:hypothetical protein BD309DRAFT_62854 [Dichomitus squalens]|uniref:Uncharacterized protein n=1 Tax=Dichomitus squalens TaxID=114155 RepID=A0A4Q9PFF3_9APHY|nr:hypothetical protein BD309DRAFT_62854 [Dichomitus squalens]TBU53679.1 hypothetical protein BD310DRAFT_133465 [Dichomitus squalens]